MTEYIKKSTAIAIVSDCVELCPIEKSEAIGRIEASEAADVAPVVHARWARTESGEWMCTNCECELSICEYGKDVTHKKRFCPECGAIMDGLDKSVLTNRKMLMDMSDEEFGNWLNYYAHDGYMNPKEGWHEWLRSPAEEAQK